jgi:hypothetical protein
MTEIERVEKLIREGVARAKAAGRKIVRGNWGLSDTDNLWTLADECCLLAPQIDGGTVYDEGDRQEAGWCVARALCISSDEVDSIINGFDQGDLDVDPHNADKVNPDFYALGARLGREFVDGVTE